MLDSPVAPARRVLLVSYLFPPSGGVGVQRALSYARYLPACGCELWVLTAANTAAPVQDPELLKLVPKNIPISRALTPEVPYAWRDWALKKFVLSGRSSSSPPAGVTHKPAGRNVVLDFLERLATPDPQKYWTLLAVRRAARLVRQHSIDAVLVTVPPFSSAQIGVRLKRLFPHLRLITEFRDEWVGYYLKELMHANDHRRRVAEHQERQAVETSDFVVAVTPSQAQSIHSRYPQQSAGKFLAIPNGYDPEMFKDFRPRPHGLDRFVITYMGTVYDNPVYSPRPFLDAVSLLPADLAERVETRFIGRVTRESDHLLAGRNQVRLYGFVPQSEGFRLLEQTDCLLLIVGNATANAGKLFEYLATGKPILAVTPDNGEVARIIRETRSGWCASPDNPAAIAGMLNEAWQRLQSPEPFQPDWKQIEKYSRPTTVRALARAAGLGTLT